MIRVRSSRAAVRRTAVAETAGDAVVTNETSRNVATKSKREALRFRFTILCKAFRIALQLTTLMLIFDFKRESRMKQLLKTCTKSEMLSVSVETSGVLAVTILPLLTSSR